jgi:formate/nitrite transporter FocA (FNT family)
MAYLAPTEFVTKMIDAGESKVFMSTRDTLIRSYMAGAILSLAAAFAVTVTVQTGQPLVGAMLFPVGFILLYLLGFDLLTGVFTLCPLALIDKRPGVTMSGILRNWGLVFCRQISPAALTVAVMMADHLDFRFHRSTQCSRPEDRHHWRRPDGGLCRARRCRHVDASSFAAYCATGWCQPVLSAP